MADENSWRTTAFRQSVVAKIDEAIRQSGMNTSRNSLEMENHVFQKAKNKEEYLGFVARLILHVREMNNTLPPMIEVIQNYEFLYDRKHKDYKNNLKKDQAWREIAEIVNMSVDDCIKHWKNLRDRYMKEKRKQASGSVSKWPYFDKMVFYNKFTKPRKKFTSTPRQREPLEIRSPSPSSSSEWSSMDTILSPQVDVDKEEVEHPTKLSSESPSETPPSSRVSSSRPRKRKYLEDAVEATKILVKTLEMTQPPKNNINRSFVEYVYSRLSEMSTEEARRKRNKMLQALEDMNL